MKNHNLKLTQHQYKPKTAITHQDEVIEPGEFYFLEVDRFLFRGRLRPGQVITMRKGCLAEQGDIVQLVCDTPSICRITVYQEGMEYSAVCVGVGESVERWREEQKKLPKERWRVEYTKNGMKRYSPWFNSLSRAFNAETILSKKYGDNVSLYWGREER
ncbi:hypothetical protein [Methylobacter sp. YRD-M1]|uniref:hypothetical protein n=1 Tax=Methylobacter sp. YRD-M1 TaxID=2911520 RepID=UPI00227C3D71|nr:hypothetical protein [Methylobacter sp. YRD-M1]WAK02782.1 hypothetical protein LZ558_03055 [Methylobacter sp. YRD-M1]